MTELLGKYGERLHAAGVHTALPPDPDHIPHGSPEMDYLRPVAFVDDVAHGIIEPDPEVLHKKVAAAAILAVDLWAEHGLRLNMGLTKTAAILAYRGKGCKQYHLDMYSQTLRTCIDFESEGWVSCIICSQIFSLVYIPPRLICHWSVKK